MIAKRYIPAGQAIGRDDVKEPPAVARGEPVEVILVAENFTIKLVAEAVTNGRIGSVVLVRNRSSGKVFKAKVVGRGRVMVKWGG
jgi:flagella basal body P-ring formation protein FlgA